MEIENREQREAADMMWFKRGIDEVETGDRDPFEFAAEVGDKKWSKEFIEKVVVLAEDKCLEKIRFLEDYQLNLRGDCVSKERVESTETNGFYGVLRNERVKLDTEETRYSVLALVASAVVKAYSIARMYEKRAKHIDGARKIPVLMYGFNKFNENRGFVPLEKDNSYFGGETDDMGHRVSDMYFMKMPSFDSVSNGADEPTYDQFFSGIPLHNQGGEEEAVSVLGRKRNKVFSNIESSGWAIELGRPEAYLKSLIIVDTLLLETQEYDERVRDEAVEHPEK